VIEVYSAILPVAVVAGVVFALRRAFPLDSKTLSTLNIYVGVPALAYFTLSRNPVDWGMLGRLFGAMGFFLAAMLAVLWVAARIGRFDNALSNAFYMTAFVNLGNYGVPVCAFAFGEGEGQRIAILIMMCGILYQNTVGVFFAQRSRHGIGRSIVRVFKLPIVYALFLGVIAQRTDFALPLVAARAVELVAEAAIPLQLICLGAQLGETTLQRSPEAFLASGFRLLAGPVVAMLAAFVLGLTGVYFDVFILQLSGPVAVGMAVYGIQFDVKPAFLSSVVAWTFIFSFITVALVLYALKLYS
jgi:hypothetical protein